MIVQNFKDLVVWQKSVDLCISVYKLTEQIPKHEQFALSSQMRRSAISIPSNISEGCKRNHKNEFWHFLGIANGSAAELETQFIIAKKCYPELKFENSENLILEVQKMLSVLIKKLKQV
jgi:four helix bundle protein